MRGGIRVEFRRFSMCTHDFFLLPPNGTYITHGIYITRHAFLMNTVAMKTDMRTPLISTRSTRSFIPFSSDKNAANNGMLQKTIDMFVWNAEQCKEYIV
jgi:hypothetical protein